MVKVTPVLLEAKDFHVTFELVIQPADSAIHRVRVVDRFKNLVCEISSQSNFPEVFTVRMPNINRSLLPVYAEIIEFNGHTTLPEEIGALYVPPNSDIPGIPLPVVATTIADFPQCETTLHTLEASKQAVLIASKRSQRLWADANVYSKESGWILLLALLPLSVAVTVILTKLSILVAMPALLVFTALFALAFFRIRQGRAAWKIAVLADFTWTQAVETHQQTYAAMLRNCPARYRQYVSLLDAQSNNQMRCNCASSR